MPRAPIRPHPPRAHRPAEVPSRRFHGRVAATLLAVVLATIAAMPGTAVAAWEPEGVDFTRPRILYRSGDLPAIQARLAREPYRTIVADMQARTALAEAYTLDDPGITAHRLKSRAAKNLAFLYAADRTLVAGEVVPFPTPADREATGERVEALLVNLFDRSRLAVPPPVGGWDRDISTSEEIVNYATAFDTMLGAGWDFGAAEAVIVDRLVSVVSELYLNYFDPASASALSEFHQNNHRSKSGAAMVIAGIVLAEHTPGPGEAAHREPTLWVEFGLIQIDRVTRFALITGDGVYGEGPFYMRFASQNLLPFARAWDRLLGGADYPLEAFDFRSPWRDPLFHRTLRWMLDVTLPDGTLAPTDDGNPGRSYYFGLLPKGDMTPHHYWRYAHTTRPFETDGNVDLAADALVTYDDSIAHEPPDGPTTAFYPEGGAAIFRSDWSEEAVMAVVQAEHYAAAEIARDREGNIVAPQSHEHPDPGSFLMHAFGERLLLDPGYISFTARTSFNQPIHHNMILVGGRGPVDPLSATIAWRSAPDADAPADGHASLTDTLDTPFLDTATSTARYGGPGTAVGTEDEAGSLVSRRFLFADERYLAIADRVEAPDASPETFTWLLHGNGGEDSGGAFAATPTGGRWTQGAARLDGGFSFLGGTPSFSTQRFLHEVPDKEISSHTGLLAEANGTALRSVALVYPSHSTEAAPEITDLERAGMAALKLVDPDGDRRVVFLSALPGSGMRTLAPADTGVEEIASDASRLLVDTHLDGRLRLVWAEEARTLRYGAASPAFFEFDDVPRTLGLALADDRASAYVGSWLPEVRIGGLGFVPQAVDGACGFRVEDGHVWVRLSRERRFDLRAAPGNARPAADPGIPLRTKVGQEVTLDGSASCDADGDPLTAAWELVSAPAGSLWQLEETDGFMPRLLTDVAGPYRVRLVVTDSTGQASHANELLVIAGYPCSDGVDNDLDGRFDAARDPECESAGEIDESLPGCGLGGEVGFLVGALATLRRRRDPCRSSSTSRSSS